MERVMAIIVHKYFTFFVILFKSYLLRNRFFFFSRVVFVSKSGKKKKKNIAVFYFFICPADRLSLVPQGPGGKRHGGQAETDPRRPAARGDAKNKQACGHEAQRGGTKFAGMGHPTL